ncbi:MAG: DNA primase [Lachnospiraceae bacterium]|nr:DNA primase [Lachnospiraceae bacterium]
MYYPDDLVEEIRLRSDIVDVIGSYIHLSRSGANHIGLCPFHNEKTGSFSVNGQKQIFKCFGCGVGGNVITFLMKYDNMTFPEAIKVLADRAGVALPEMEYTAEEKKQNQLKQQILQVNKEAAKYYYSVLKSPNGKKGEDYLKGRGLSDDTIRNFGLGFAPHNANLYNYLKSLPEKYGDDVLKASGIFNFSESYGVRDKFWDRVIFPIMDANNKVIAFGGRLMSEGAIEAGDKKIPKYLNSPETEVFDKSRNLYGLNIARRTRAAYLILCEGYMDVIALHQAGFDMAVASLGTAFTSGHATLIRRFTKKVYLSYDSDDAGVKAALRALPILKAAGISAKVIDMRPYKDPDEFIKNLGREEYERRIENAEGSFFYEIRMLEKEFDLDDPESKTRFCTEIANRILRLEEEIERNNYIEAICTKYNLSVESLSKLVAKQAMKTENMEPRPIIKSGIHDKKDADKLDTAKRNTQKTLLTWICDEPEIFDTVKSYIKPADFSGELYIKAAELLFEQIEEDARKINVAKIIGCFTDEDEQTEVASLFSSTKLDMSDDEKPEALKRLIIKILEQVAQRINEAAADGDIEAMSRGFVIKQTIEKLKKTDLKKW